MVGISGNQVAIIDESQYMLLHSPESFCWNLESRIVIENYFKFITDKYVRLTDILNTHAHQTKLRRTEKIEDKGFVDWSSIKLQLIQMDSCD